MSCSPRRPPRRTTTMMAARGQRPAGRRYVIRGGHVMSMDPTVGDFVAGRRAGRGQEDRRRRAEPACRRRRRDRCRGRIVMPGFVDTHHHQFETALRSFLADGHADQRRPAARRDQLLPVHPRCTFAPVYRPQDVYISELFGSLSQLDAGVTTVHDISQIHHSPEHSDAAIKGAARLRAPRSCSAIFESAGADLLGAGNQYPNDATSHQEAVVLVERPAGHMIMGGEIYLRRRRRERGAGRSGASSACRSRRTSSRRFGMRPDVRRASPPASAQRSFGSARQPVHPHDRHVGRRLAGGARTPARMSRSRCRSR